jgi:hypothetical protein
MESDIAFYVCAPLHPAPRWADVLVPSVCAPQGRIHPGEERRDVCATREFHTIVQKEPSQGLAPDLQSPARTGSGSLKATRVLRSGPGGTLRSPPIHLCTAKTGHGPNWITR